MQQESDYDSLRRRKKFETTESPLAIKEAEGHQEKAAGEIGGSDDNKMDDKETNAETETILGGGETRDSDIDEPKPAPVDIGQHDAIYSKTPSGVLTRADLSPSNCTTVAQKLD